MQNAKFFSYLKMQKSQITSLFTMKNFFNKILLCRQKDYLGGFKSHHFFTTSSSAGDMYFSS